jgi:hypothetical protein
VTSKLKVEIPRIAMKVISNLFQRVNIVRRLPCQIEGQLVDSTYLSVAKVTFATNAVRENNNRNIQQHHQRKNRKNGRIVHLRAGRGSFDIALKE